MRAIVVGAGIDGLATAWSLAKKGVEVTLLEQGSSIPNPLAASGDWHRIIRRAYGAFGGYQSRIGEAYDAWSEVWCDIGEMHLIDSGFLLVSQQAGDEADSYRTGLEKGGYPIENLSADEMASRYPFFDASTIRAASFSPEGGILMCRKIADGLVAWLKNNGCDVRTESKVVSVNAEDASVRLSDGKVLRADHVVVAAGAWVTDLLPTLSDRLTTYRTAVAYLSPPDDLQAHWQGAPVVLDVGGTVDGWMIPPVGPMGLKVGAGIHKTKSHADDGRTPRDDEGHQLRGYFAPPLARIDEYTIDEVVTCAYTFTRDEHFLLEWEDNLTVVSACSGHGYKFGAAVGRRVASGVVSGNLADTAAWLDART